MRFRQFLIFLINPTSRFKVTSSSKTRCGYYTDTKDQVVLWVRPDRQTDRQTDRHTYPQLLLTTPSSDNRVAFVSALILLLYSPINLSYL